MDGPVDLFGERIAGLILKVETQVQLIDRPYAWNVERDRLLISR